MHWLPIPKLDPPFVVVKEDAEFKKLQNGGVATFTGRLDYHDGRKKALRDKRGSLIGMARAGFGHLGAWDVQLVLQSVIHPVYRPAETKRKR